MKFHFWTDSNHTYIAAEFEEGDSRTGKREEGMGVEITLQNQILKYDYVVKDIHPDILGLICLTNFFPFVGNNVEFPMPVSPRLVEGFRNPIFLGKKELNFVNVDPDIPKYSGIKIGISFGGGCDSTAVSEMFPEALIVHEAHIKNHAEVYTPVHDIISNLSSDSAMIIKSNQRYCSIPGGWHSWPCSTVCTLLLATDRNIGLILTGTVMGSNWLWNGTKFYDRIANRKFHGFTGNHWQSVFHAIGIPMFSPIDGISELGSIRLSLNKLNDNKVSYCLLGKNGGNCGRCSKCLRKAIERKALDPSFDLNWSDFDTPEIHDFLRKRPLYFGHIFTYVANQNILPKWIEELISDVDRMKTDWPLKYYSPALDFCPEKWKELLEERILSTFELMTKEEEAELISWNQESS